MTRCCRSVVLQQVGSHLGYTGRVANPFGKASRDPTRTWPSLRSRCSIEGALISFVGRVPSIRAAGRRRSRRLLALTLRITTYSRG